MSSYTKLAFNIRVYFSYKVRSNLDNCRGSASCSRWHYLRRAKSCKLEIFFACFPIYHFMKNSEPPYCNYHNEINSLKTR